jgi:hypothetical protein
MTSDQNKMKESTFRAIVVIITIGTILWGALIVYVGSKIL